MRLSLEKKVISGFGFMLLLLCLIGGAVYQSTTQLVRANRSVKHTLMVLEKLEDVASHLKDAETGQRGYLLTGKVAYLGPYRDATAVLGQEIEALQQLTVGNSAQQRRLNALEPLVVSKLAELDQTIDLRKKAGFEAALQVVLTDRGRLLMDQIRVLINEMREEEKRSLEHYSAAAAARAQFLIGGVALGTLSAFTLTPLAIFVINQEATQRLRAEKARLESEQRFRRLSEATFEAVAISEQGRVLDTNRSFAELFGYEPAQEIGMSAVEFVVPECREGVRQKVALGEENPYETVCLRKDGTTFPAEIRGKMLRSQEHMVRVTAFRDITERKQAEEKLRTYAANLEKVNQELEQFNYIAAHDLKTPLRTIATRMEMLPKQLGPLSGQAQHQMSRILLAVRHMDRLLSDLLAYSRVGTRTELPVFTDSNAIVQHALDNFLNQIQTSGAIIQVEPNLPTVLADPNQVAQVLQNLISNSIKFCRVTPQIRVSATCSQDECTFCVADNGIGIAAGHEQRIFGIFKRLHSQEEYEGTGIGLAIVKRIIEWHGGRTWVESEVDKGSKFFFTLWRADNAGGTGTTDRNLASGRQLR